MSTHIPQSMGLVSSSTCLFHCCFSTVWPPCEETRVHPFWTAVLVPPASKHKQHYMVESINTTSFLPAVSPDKWTKQTVLDLVSRTLVSTFQSCINSTAGTIHHWRDVCLHHWWHSADKRTRHTQHITMQPIKREWTWVKSTCDSPRQKSNITFIWTQLGSYI